MQNRNGAHVLAVGSLLSSHKWPLWMTSEVQSVFGRVSRAMRLKPQILQLEAASFRVSSGHEDLEGPQDGLIYIFVLDFLFSRFLFVWYVYLHVYGHTLGGFMLCGGAGLGE